MDFHLSILPNEFTLRPQGGINLKDFLNFIETNYSQNKFFYYWDSDGTVVTPESPQIEWVQNGATKVVFKLKNFPSEVIKIPLKGYLNDLNETVPMKNYCEIEFKNYQIAQQMGVHNFLSPIKKITNQFYTQKLIVKDLFGQPMTVDQKILKWFNDRKLIEITKQINAAATLTLFKEQYSLMELKKFNSFLEKTQINDLTNENFCLDINNKIVLFDYSGYKGDSSNDSLL